MQTVLWGPEIKLLWRVDYSSADDEDFPAPIANSTRRGGRAPVIVNTASAGRNGSGGGKRGGRVTRSSSRNNSRSGEGKICGR